ncbi:hypothetical protein DXU04_12030 [Bradyrhizobium diazoefficiens]|nr:hypothetical protein BD122_05655 [Bradyrhizobium diazoefficiens]KOY12357.1 hypothetical protein AF336_04300 [Bradyrhizobium diazoefficiens]
MQFIAIGKCDSQVRRIANTEVFFDESRLIGKADQTDKMRKGDGRLEGAYFYRFIFKLGNY